ncbi:MAG: acyl-CoA dehydrogenase, partial [Bacteroidota bacterium]
MTKNPETPALHRNAKADPFQFHDHYLVEDLLTDEHRMVRGAVRDWVKAEVSPIIEDAFERA